MEKNLSYYYNRCRYCPHLHGKENKITQMFCKKALVNGWIRVESYIVNIEECYYSPDANKGIIMDKRRQFTLTFLSENQPQAYNISHGELHIQ